MNAQNKFCLIVRVVAREYNGSGHAARRTSEVFVRSRSMRRAHAAPVMPVIGRSTRRVLISAGDALTDSETEFVVSCVLINDSFFMSLPLALL